MLSKTAIQFIKSLQDKKQRQKYDQFVVEGEKSIAELLKSSYKIVKLVAVNSWIVENQLFIKGLECTEVSEDELKKISFHQAPQRVLAVVKIPQFNHQLSSDVYTLALDEIQDPGNLGTIIRIADWYGIKKLICSKGCTDVYNPKCISATMGSFLRVEVVYADIIEMANRYQLPLIVTSFDGENVHTFQTQQKGMIVIGNEGHGVSKEIMQMATYKLTIPKIGGAESLNAAVSTAIVLDNLVR
jgi:RNA methyltransferase, TrmH family